jgi:hypothetical protein
MYQPVEATSWFGEKSGSLCMPVKGRSLPSIAAGIHIGLAPKGKVCPGNRRRSAMSGDTYRLSPLMVQSLIAEAVGMTTERDLRQFRNSGDQAREDS